MEGMGVLETGNGDSERAEEKESKGEVRAEVIGRSERNWAWTEATGVGRGVAAEMGKRGGGKETGRERTVKMENKTIITEIQLLAFSHLLGTRSLFFTLIICVYCITISGNLLIIVLVSLNRHLHVPMYFFLTQISTSDILLITDIVPEMLSIIIDENGKIALKTCITQLYFFGVFETAECFLLTAMSYDRYLAICDPLKYNSIMDHKFCIQLIVICWLLSISIMLIIPISIAQLAFCEPGIIDHFFCDIFPLLEISCSDTILVQIEAFFLCVPILIIPFLIVLLSYVYIVLAIVRISSTTGRQKTFLTCSSHLTVVSIYYGTLISIYTVPPKGKSLSVAKVMSLFYTVFTPMLNPIIYSLRNKDIKDALKKIIQNIYRINVCKRSQ
ncbi:olfactory receptor 1496-like [Pelobates fuscus]|uniref:olfactory receptor 1496-like n=1 Tax=Pelobates fuscus TaxID=191477 RepID=UPI002FE44956